MCDAGFAYENPNMFSMTIWCDRPMPSWKRLSLAAAAVSACDASAVGCRGYVGTTAVPNPIRFVAAPITDNAPIASYDIICAIQTLANFSSSIRCADLTRSFSVSPTNADDHSDAHVHSEICRVGDSNSIRLTGQAGFDTARRRTTPARLRLESTAHLEDVHGKRNHRHSRRYRRSRHRTRDSLGEGRARDHHRLAHAGEGRRGRRRTEEDQPANAGASDGEFRGRCGGRHRRADGAVRASAVDARIGACRSARARS